MRFLFINLSIVVTYMGLQYLVQKAYKSVLVRCFMEMEFVPLDFGYFDFEGKNYIKLIGRTSKGKRVCVIDSYEPNFWVILKKGYEKDAKRVADKISKVEVDKKNRKSCVLRTEIKQKKFLGKPVTGIQVFVTNHKDCHDVASEIGDEKAIEFRREYDVSLITKYIKERGVFPMQWHKVEGELVGEGEFGGILNGFDVDVCVHAKKISREKKSGLFEPKILAYDIEADNVDVGKGEIMMISLYSEGFKKVLTWKKCKGAQKYVDFFEDEKSMIEGFVSEVRKFSPDILTGYFSDGFDLPYIKARAKEHKVKLGLGLDDSEPTFSRGRIPSGRISGIVHVDLLRFIDAVFSQYLQSETLSLNEVGRELVGEEKEDFDFARLANMKNSDWLDFFSYNVQDSVLTFKLAKKIWPDIMEFSRVVREPLFEVTRDRMSAHVENYLIHNLDRFDEIIEKRPTNEEIGRRRNMGKYEGAFVFKPVPGLYEDIVMFDFTSMYASVIVSYNLSLSTHLGGSKFSKKRGFFPEVLSEIIELRKKHKKELAKNSSGILRARSNAYKLLANASYGYLGFFGARYYCREAAASTARLARENILSAIDRIEKEGYKIIYSDTDSIAFLRGKNSKTEIKDFLKKINSNLPGIMELDLEGFFSRGLFVSKRTTKEGAKKKYALMDERGNPKYRGFETVRRDWCRLARNLQSEVIRLILEKGNEKKALEYFRKEVKRLKERKVEQKEIVIKTGLKKPLREYVSEGPHVVAAKKMKARGIHVSTGMVIEYIVGESKGKGKRVGDRVYLTDENAKYDVDYYLNNQIIPAVENIFDVFGVDTEDIVDGESQKRLF